MKTYKVQFIVAALLTLSACTAFANSIHVQSLNCAEGAFIVTELDDVGRVVRQNGRDCNGMVWKAEYPAARVLAAHPTYFYNYSVERIVAGTWARIAVSQDGRVKSVFGFDANGVYWDLLGDTQIQ